MSHEALITAMTAEADQAIARHREYIQEMVATYRRLLADGIDPAQATGSVTLANLVSYDQFKSAQLLAVAVSMLAETCQPEGVA